MELNIKIILDADFKLTLVWQFSTETERASWQKRHRCLLSLAYLPFAFLPSFPLLSCIWQSCHLRSRAILSSARYIGLLMLRCFDVKVLNFKVESKIVNQKWHFVDVVTSVQTEIRMEFIYWSTSWYSCSWRDHVEVWIYWPFSTICWC